MDKTLDYLYGREYERKGHARGVSLDPSHKIKALDWLQETRKLISVGVYHFEESQAIERYGITDWLQDPKTLATLEQIRPLPRHC